jgi:hypothetical protein
MVCGQRPDTRMPSAAATRRTGCEAKGIPTD